MMGLGARVPTCGCGCVYMGMLILTRGIGKAKARFSIGNSRVLHRDSRFEMGRDAVAPAPYARDADSQFAWIRKPSGFAQIRQ